MSDQNQTNQTPAPTFVDRVMSNDSAKKGAAAAIAGLVVALVQEAIWPSK